MTQDQAFLLSKGAAITILEDLARGSEPSTEILRPFPSLVKVEGSFRGLHDSLKSLCDALPRPKGPRDGSPVFESEGAVIVHKALQHLPEELLGDSEFWLWMNIFQCRDVVQWRMGDNASWGNYGVEGKFEGLICRMFFRAHLVYSDHESDPYILARKGSQDFWRSFMLRRNYAAVKPMARAVAQRVNFSGSGNLDDAQVRILGPKITQLNSSYSYELLDQGRCEKFVDREAATLFPDAGS